MKHWKRTLALAALVPLLQAWTLREGHPRIYFTADDVPLLLERISGSHADQWNDLYGYAERRLADAPADVAVDTWSMISVVSALAFVCRLTGEERFCSHARDILLAMAAADPAAGGDDTPPRNRMEAMGIGFDWAYDHLSDSDRAAIMDGIRAHVNQWIDFVNEPNFVSGHSRKGNYDIMVALAAIVDEAPDMESVLNQVRDNFALGYNPAQGWIAEDGGYHMGWAYGASYNTPVPYMTWERAVTDEDLTEDWQMLLSNWFLYGLRGDGTYPREGDVFSITPSSEAAVIVLRACVLGHDPHACGLYAEFRESVLWDPNFVEDIIYYDPSAESLGPEGLPMSRCFGHAGFLLARDRWDEAAVHMSFKSASFLSINHHHLDNNHLELSYGAATLLLDTGQYDSYGSDHWDNYYTRSVAHNTLVVVDPEEAMTLYSSPVSNDGGQVFMSARTVDDIAEGGPNRLDGLLLCEEAGGHAFALGDATDAYWSEKLSRFHRHVVYLRDAGSAWSRPLVVVFDDVRVIKDGLAGAILWHLPSGPAIDGAAVSADAAGAAAVHLFTLLPDPARIESVGGPGREFWVDGANFPPSDTTAQEAGEWRIEVSPEAPSSQDYFLTVIYPADSGEAAPAAPQRVLSGEAEGAVMGDRVVVFALADEPPLGLSYSVPCTAARHDHRVFGLLPSALYSVEVNGEASGESATTAAGSVLFTADCGPGESADVTVTFQAELPEEEVEPEPLPDGGDAADVSQDPAVDAGADGADEDDGGKAGGCSCSLAPR